MFQSKRSSWMLLVLLCWFLLGVSVGEATECTELLDETSCINQQYSGCDWCAPFVGDAAEGCCQKLKPGQLCVCHKRSNGCTGLCAVFVYFLGLAVVGGVGFCIQKCSRQFQRRGPAAPVATVDVDEGGAPGVQMGVVCYVGQPPQFDASSRSVAAVPVISAEPSYPMAPHKAAAAAAAA